MKEIKGPFFAFLLLGMLLTKISAFHVYEHQDSSKGSVEHCEHCVLALDGQQAEGLITPIFTLWQVTKPVVFEPKINIRGIAHTSTFNSVILFSRPPPTVA